MPLSSTGDKLQLQPRVLPRPRGSGTCRGQGGHRAAAAARAGAARSGLPSPRVMSSVLQLCRCHPEGSLSWGKKSESTTECRPAGSPSGYPPETAQIIAEPPSAAAQLDRADRGEKGESGLGKHAERKPAPLL